MIEKEPHEKDLQPEEDKPLSERLKEWAGEITNPPEAAEYDENETNPVTGQRGRP